MSDRYPGGLIRKTPPTITPPVDGEGGSAPGIWTLEQASYYEGTGEWPKPVLPRELYAWGDNTEGKLGDNSVVTKSSPTQIGTGTTWLQVSAAYGFTTAVKTDGTLWSWGLNTEGQLGLNDAIDRSSPTQIGALTVWASVSTGYSHVAARKTDGTIWLWGSNSTGELGQNDRITGSSPVQVGALSTWSQINAGEDFTVAVKTDGTVWIWGTDLQGRLGDPFAPAGGRSSPVQLGALTNWATVATKRRHTLATTTGGELYVWGRNESGRLGNNTEDVNVSSPVQVGALTTWLRAATSYNNSIAVKTDNTLWTWGSNSDGQLGQNNRVSRSSPVQIGALTDWSQGSIAFDQAAAIKTDGTLWVWGNNGTGELGQNDAINRSSPVQVGALTTWEQVSAGGNFTAATTKG